MPRLAQRLLPAAIEKRIAIRHSGRNAIRNHELVRPVFFFVSANFHATSGAWWIEA
uniref:Uncharacterized protein n=1 Tax=Rhizobium rhizogenes TaxID=359 RepID=A0A7S4ZTA2_RHIRH|nr:hypothetical protein pC6.5b_312 [Rhizobium rhizogenes]